MTETLHEALKRLAESAESCIEFGRAFPAYHLEEVIEKFFPPGAPRCELHGAPKASDTHHECGCEIGKPACLSLRQELEALRAARTAHGEMKKPYEPVLAILRDANDGHAIEYHEQKMIDALDALVVYTLPHPDTARILKTLVQRVGGSATMTEHDRARADRYQLRWTDNGHTLSVLAVSDT